jgi:SPX domain
LLSRQHICRTNATTIPVEEEDDHERVPSSPSHPNDISIALLLKIYKLSRDLLLLETYSIMALTSFSKILKKHDKVTGYNTKHAFMTKIVIPSNFVQTEQPPLGDSRRRRHGRSMAQRGRPTMPLPAIQEEEEEESITPSSTTTGFAKRRSVRIHNAANQSRNRNRSNRSSSSIGTTAEVLPSLHTMIDQCEYWYSILSERYETLQMQREQPPPPPPPVPTLQYDEYLFLNMIQQFQQ